MESNRYVITGGPGSGKSTLIAALNEAGYSIFKEAGRQIIREQVKASGTALPWTDPPLFAEEMFARDLRSYEAASRERGIVFFDRGLPDVLGYLNLTGLPIPDHMRRAAEQYRYNRRVFIAPPWPEIFSQDEERKQTPDEAERTYQAMVRIYGAYDYDLVELPRISVIERVAFVRNVVDGD